MDHIETIIAIYIIIWIFFSMILISSAKNQKWVWINFIISCLMLFLTITIISCTSRIIQQQDAKNILLGKPLPIEAFYVENNDDERLIRYRVNDRK